MSLARGRPTALDKQPESFVFTDEELAEIEGILTKYPKGRERSAIGPILYIVQRRLGWVPVAAMNAVAERLCVPNIGVYEVATFYTMYNLEPVGEYLIQVCTTTPCMLCDSDSIVEACMRHLGIGWDETTPDGMFTMKEVECLGACCNAPMVQINDDYYEDLTPETMVVLLEALKRGERPKAGSQSGRHTSEPQSGPTTLQREG